MLESFALAKETRIRVDFREFSVYLSVTFLPLTFEGVSPLFFMCLDEKRMQKNGGKCNLGSIGDCRKFSKKWICGSGSMRSHNFLRFYLKIAPIRGEGSELC